MKKLMVTLFVALFCVVGMNAQTIVNVTGNITANTTWYSSRIYILEPGFHYVTNNATLTVQAGTLIKSTGGALVVTRGAKLNAIGTQTRPIVFTSNQPAGQRNPGDWGGILLLGRAPINDPAGQRLAEGGIDPTLGLYGGVDPADNSGSLQFVRIEFAGVPFQPNNETNGLTMGGVGTGTTINNIQVSFGGDDAFEWFGGTVNCRNLVAHRNLDDDMDADYGFSGNVQFGVVVRDPAIADVSRSNGFEVDNDATGSTNSPFTDANFSNFTFFGPQQTNGQAGINANYGRALHLRRSNKVDIFNSVFAGYPTGFLIDGINTCNYYQSGDLKLNNCILAGMAANYAVAAAPAGFTTGTVQGIFLANGGTELAQPTDLQYANPYNFTAPSFLPSPNSPVNSGASFAAAELQNQFFTQTSYRGAFGVGNDWTRCWCEFDPQTAPYTTATNYLTTLPTITGTPVICSGNAATVTASAGFASYLWSNGATTASTTTAVAGAITVTVTNARGCTASASVNITVASLPQVPVINANLPLVVCQTGSTLLNPITLSTQAIPGLTIQWQLNGANLGGQTNPTYTATRAGSFTVRYTNASGCPATSAPTVIVINQEPKAKVAGALYICGATPRTLTASPGNPVANPNLYSYQWYQNGMMIPGATNRTYVTIVADNYSVSVTNNTTNCGKLSPAVTLIPYATPANPVITAQGPITFPAGGSVTLAITAPDPLFTYQWYGVTGGLIVGATNTSYTATTGNRYRARAGNGPCLSNYSNIILVTVQPGQTEMVQQDVNLLEAATEINLFPNPANDGFTTIEFELSNDQQVEVSVVDMTGRVVFSELQSLMAGGQFLNLDVDALAQGTYFVTVRGTEINRTAKLVIQK